MARARLAQRTGLKKMRYTAIVGDRVYEVIVGPEQSVTINGETHTIDFRRIDSGALYSLLMDNRSWEVLAEPDSDNFRILLDGELHLVRVEDERTRKIEKGLGKVSAPSGEFTLKAPMPGLVREVLVQLGAEVKPNQGVVILEAMKMENELRAARGGQVKEIRVKAGDKVEQGQPLLVIK